MVRGEGDARLTPLTTGQRRSLSVMAIVLVALDILVLTIGIWVLARGSVAGVLFVVPVVILTRTLVCGMNRIRQR